MHNQGGYNIDLEVHSHDSNHNHVNQNKHAVIKESCRNWMDSNIVTSFMTILTIYALYSDDAKILAFEKSADFVFGLLSSCAGVIFLIEIVLQCWCVENYMRLPNMSKMRTIDTERKLVKKAQIIWSAVYIGSFYFWLDLMATCSMLFEVMPSSLSESDSGFTSTSSARAGKASRAGAKAARMIRVVRMIRLVRLVKLYKYLSEKKVKKEGTIIPAEYDDALENMPPESHVGAEMSDRTTKKVIVGCLIMLIVIPLLQVTDVEYLDEYGMQMVFERRENINFGSNIFISMNEMQSSYKSWELMEDIFIASRNCIQVNYFGFQDGLHLESEIPNERSSPSELRALEKSTLTISNQDDSLKMSAIFDKSEQANEEALLAILLTTFVIILLAAGTMTFSRDVNFLVIIPIEKMVQLVREISANPLGKDFSLTPEDIKRMDDGMETTLLLRTISKIAGLMRIGFGEAGAEIIGKNLNMAHDDGCGNAINLLGHGTKIQSIFGFCDIRNFTDTTECLQEEVMLFVNRIAHILHNIVVQCGGAANKNIGDAFLLTWKIDPSNLGSYQDHKYSGDKALYSLLKTMIEMNKHGDFICNFSPSALGALYERIPGYKCRMGCGLHFGWAVEGAIGSDKKIDASYISPHVNWAEFLESSTKEYGVPILMSEPFFRLLSPQAMKHCRLVDKIKKSVNEDVVSLYTYDADLDLNFEARNHAYANHGRASKTRKTITGLNLNCHRKENGPNNIMRSAREVTTLFDAQETKTFPTSTNKRKTLTIRSLSSHSDQSTSSRNIEIKTKSEHRKNSQVGELGDGPDILLPTYSPEIWDNDPELVKLRSQFNDSHRLIWSKTINAFIEGDWSCAIVNANKVLEMTSNQDGPSKRLLAVIAKHNFTVPANWGGFLSLYE